MNQQPAIPTTTDNGRFAGLLDLVRAYLDIILGTIGAALAVVAITVLAGWPVAMLAAGLALIALATWMPSWD